MKTYASSIVLLFTLSFIVTACSPEKLPDNAEVQTQKSNDVVAMFLSDFHAGENYGAVSREVPTMKKGEYDSVPGIPNLYFHKKITALLHNIDSIASVNNGNIPYLILLGDIFDIAVHEASDAFNLAHDFFNAPLYNNRSFTSYFDTVIYLPGNHDHHVWHMLQEKYYIQDRLLSGREALPFPHQSQGILDITKTGKLLNNGNKLIPSGSGKNFISYLLSDHEKEIHVFYPNLYIRYADDKGICVTHGHFFEPNWNKDTSVMAYFPDVNNMPEYFKNLENTMPPSPNSQIIRLPR
ncbi:MAG: hypothetical protein U5Q03_14555 [Bacteroidota bacterium]|nr:hypothetical protein [Bacteroidota bacterium]